MLNCCRQFILVRFPATMVEVYETPPCYIIFNTGYI